MRKIILIITILLITGVTALVLYLLQKERNYTIEKEPNISNRKMSDQINSIRMANHLDPLMESENLCYLSSIRLSELHTTYNHDKFADIAYRYAEDNGYITISENIAGVPLSAGVFKDLSPESRVSKSWMSSPPHKAAILDPRFTQTCVKCDSKYCVQIFAEPRPTNP